MVDVGISSHLRADAARIRQARNEIRDPDRLTAHYAIEAALARELAQSGRAERSRLYSDVYQRLFDSVPDHPQHAGGNERRASRIEGQSRALLRLLGPDAAPDATYVEIGCGDAALTKVIAGHVRHAIGVDVTEKLITGPAPAAFAFVLSDGVIIDVPDDSADLVYSNQLMEHLHVDDAVFQLGEIYRMLKPGGKYVCSTPNRLTGPHDISVYFGYEASGLHMREYDHRSLAAIFRAAGFAKIKATVSLKGQAINLPVGMMAAAESVFEMLPAAARARLALIGPVTNIAGINLIGIK
jgi:SAM-dependent methyltransferase